MDNYCIFRKYYLEGYKDYPENGLLNFISSGFPKNSLDDIVSSLCVDEYGYKLHSKGSTRIGGKYLPTTPFIAIVPSESRRHLNVKTFYYVVYLFRTDLKGFYLTLSVGGDDIPKFNLKGFRNEIIEKYDVRGNGEFDRNRFALFKGFGKKY